MRLPGPICATTAARNDKGTHALVRTLSPTERHSPDPLSRSPYALAAQFEQRIAATRTLAELNRVAVDLEAALSSLEQAHLIKRPIPGDRAVQDAVHDAFTERMGILEQIIFTGIYDGVVSRDVSEGLLSAFRSAFLEVAKKILTARLATFAKDAAVALRSRRPRDILKISAETTAALVKYFSDKDGLMRDVVTVMRKNGLEVGQEMEAALRQLLGRRLMQAAHVISTIMEILSSTFFISLRVFLTPTAIASDAEELFSRFDEVNDALRLRYERLLPPLPEIPIRLTPDLVTGPQIRPPHGM